MTICSTTLWVGHLLKWAVEIDLTDKFGEFGVVTNVDVSACFGVWSLSQFLLEFIQYAARPLTRFFQFLVLYLRLKLYQNSDLSEVTFV